jgi:hypothetical protein
MTQWEYLTLMLEAKLQPTERETLEKRFNRKVPKRAPEALIPELNQLGAAGWEMIHMEPVPHVGGKGDVLFNGVPRWSSTYFCVFKRPRPTTAIPPTPPQS